ncbi:pilus assembly PilX N-terminal domain-containing protein [Bacillus sp. 1P02SD]|uniref:pilus assembly PilX N-terminal domain-containing protein n=1 Tax=Bacillus sp. 1P02SD TaxID=3132264 RepID=UPI0039A3E74B
MKKQTSFIQNEKGIALVMVLLILTVMTILGLAIMGLTLNNMKMSSGERTYQSTYYIAESGITYTMDMVNQNIVNIYNDSATRGTFFSEIDHMVADINNEPPYRNFEEAFGHIPEAKITIEKIGNYDVNDNYRDYKLTSIGTIDNRSRTVEKQIRISWVDKSNIDIPDTAVFVKEKIDLSRGAQIIGDAGTNSSAPNSVIINGGASITGTIYVGPNAKNDVINNSNFQVVNLPYQNTFDLPPFPDFPSNSKPENERINNSYNVIDNGSLLIDNYLADNYFLNMDKDLKFNDIYITRNRTLNINIGNADRSIVVDHLNIVNGKINIIGAGKLTLYVTNKITMGSSSVINTTDEIESKKMNEATKSNLIKEQIKKLDIFYKGSTLEMAGGQKIYGSLYAQNADIEMTRGSGFQGHIITGGVKINIDGDASAVTQVFYAPNANVKILGGGSVKGNIISKNLTITGGGVITYEKVSFEDLPPMFGGTTETISPTDILSAEPTREK